MFTGIVEDVGRIEEIDKKSKDVIYSISPNKLDVRELKPGESIAINGTCLTVIRIGKRIFNVEASLETLGKTNLSKLKAGSKVNLERSLRVGDRMGGHIVNGHIDGLGRVIFITKRGESKEMWISLSKELSKYIVEKGSIAVDGVSLTINKVMGNKFSVNIITYTQNETILSELKAGNYVNIECDIVGKYVEKFLLGEGEKKSIKDLIQKL